jgi:hypothetical protein
MRGHARGSHTSVPEDSVPLSGGEWTLDGAAGAIPERLDRLPRLTATVCLSWGFVVTELGTVLVLEHVGR